MHLILLSALVSLCWTTANAQVLLYYSKPAKGKHAGLYGGTIKTSEEGKLQVDQTIATHSYHTDGGLKSYSAGIRSIIVDDWTRTVLIQLKLQTEDVELLKGHTCQIDQKRTNTSVKVLIDGIGSTKDIGPFAMYDGQLFFVYKIETEEQGKKSTAYEVRQVNFKKSSCKVKDYPITAGSLFTVEDCTDFSGHLLYEYADANEKLTPLDIKLVKEEDMFRALVSMESKISDSDGVVQTYTLQLIVTDKDQKKNSKTLKTVEVLTMYSKWELVGIGSVAYQNGRICWSAMDRIYCWNYENQAVSNEKMILAKGESSSSGACSGTDILLANITTGVAFIEKKDQLDVFFGCLVDSGGAGVVTIKGDTKNIYPLRTNSSKVLATTMAVADNCLDYKDKPYTIIGSYSASTVIFNCSLLPSLLMLLIISLLHSC